MRSHHGSSSCSRSPTSLLASPLALKVYGRRASRPPPSKTLRCSWLSRRPSVLPGASPSQTSTPGSYLYDLELEEGSFGGGPLSVSDQPSLRPQSGMPAWETSPFALSAASSRCSWQLWSALDDQVWLSAFSFMSRASGCTCHLSRRTLAVA